jgi:hypothetical protein
MHNIKYTTTWDRTSQFKYTNLATPINFVTPGAAAAADIVINDATVYQVSHLITLAVPKKLMQFKDC